jgi:hypothetical protein
MRAAGLLAAEGMLPAGISSAKPTVVVEGCSSQTKCCGTYFSNYVSFQ